MMCLRVVLLSAVCSAAAAVDHCSVESADSDACAQLESTESQSMSLLQTELAVRSTQASVRAKPVVQDASDDYQDPPGVTLLAKSAEEPCEQTDGHCLPRCSWSCTSSVCDQACEPECLKPECQTHCPLLGEDDAGKKLAHAGYKFQCKKPKCEVQCPKEGCAGNQCPGCKSVCHKPECELACVGNSTAKDTEKCNLCETVCLQPKCSWKCKEPSECPKPECKMHCEVPTGCAKSYGGFPEPANGMVIVDPEADDAAALLEAKKTEGKSLLQTGTSHGQTMTMKIRKMVQVPGSDRLQTVYEDLTLPVMD